MEITDIVLKKAAMKGLTDPSYIRKVWTLLEGIKTGDVIEIEKITKAETREDFIEAVKLYMDETRENYCKGLSFRHGYKELTRYDIIFNKDNRRLSLKVELLKATL